MRKFLTLVLGLSVAGLMIYGTVGSAAWFTDQATLNVTGTAGQIDFKLSGDVSGKSPSLVLTNLQPGVWTSQYRVNVYNQDPSTTMAVKYRFQSALVSQSVGGFYGKLNVKVQHTFCGTPNPESWPAVYNGSLSGLYVDSTTTAGIISTTLGVNITHCYYLSFELDPSAGNAYQGATVSFQIDYDATQPDNPGWAQ